MVAIVLSEEDPRSVPTGLFVMSLNGMIETHLGHPRARQWGQMREFACDNTFSIAASLT